MKDDGSPFPGPDTPAASDAPEVAAGDDREALRAEATGAQERYLRTLADFDNFRKRTARDRDDWRRRAQEDLLREILPVLDNFDRALTAEPGSGPDPGFRAGVELIHREFLKALDRLGVRPFVAVGEPFDPQRHEAVGRVERGDVDDQTVVAETLRGYLFHERVLRPAQVVVGIAPRSNASGAAGFDA